MPQGMLSLNIENGVTIVLMALILYLVAAFIFQLFGRAIGGTGAGGGAVAGTSATGTAPGLSWSTNFNLAA